MAAFGAQYPCNDMLNNKIIDKEIGAQKRLIQRLKREIFGIDKSVKSSYIREFHAEFIYFGDYHPLTAGQGWRLQLMRELSARGRKVVLAMEMLYVQQQEQLDRWMKGSISEEEFLASIDYKSEWGFQWESYRRIFDLARDPFIPIFGIDAEPRDHLKYIRRRDRLIAERIKNIRRFFPGYLVLVMIGESHLASGHLPADVKRACEEKLVETIIVQNMDEIYWRLLKEGKEHIEAVRVGDGTFCMFTASPLIKYQSYREIIDHWVEGEEADRFVPVLEEMVRSIVTFLFGSDRRVKVTVNGNEFGNIEDIFPEVHCRQTYKSFTSLLRSKKMSHSGVVAVTESLRRYGVSYVPILNDFFVLRFSSSGAAMEAARFILSAMRGRIGASKKGFRRAEDRFYSFILEEALVYTGAKIVDPTLDCMKKDPLLRGMDVRGAVVAPAAGLTLPETRSMIKMLKYHFERERSAGSVLRTTEKLRRIHRLGIKKRLLIVRALGHTLGEAIYQGHLGGGVATDDILELFRHPIVRPDEAELVYLQWVKRTGPFRGPWRKGRAHLT
jgi:hypothetical protein